MNCVATSKDEIKLLNLLARFGKKGLVLSEQDDRAMLDTSKGIRIFSSSIVKNAKSDGLVVTNCNHIAITGAGISKLRRHMCDHDPYQGQHRQLQQSSVKLKNSIQHVTRNNAESPLARIFHRKQKDGTLGRTYLHGFEIAFQ